jgi:environmental stress-induced protein Ves
VTIRLLRAAERIATPWKNGGGVTREIAASPPGAGIDAFDWRVSIAEVSAGGPFSTFSGVDRFLTVIEGSGIRLEVAGMEPVSLDTASPPYAFSGDAACGAELTGGPIRDLNVMVRRGVYRAGVRRLLVSDETAVDAVADQTLVVAIDPLAFAGGERLAAEDALVVSRGTRLALDGRAARALLIELRASRGPRTSPL